MGTSTTGFNQMKKIVIALSAAMLLGACAQDQAAAPAPARAPAPVAAAPAPTRTTQTATVTATTLSLRASASTRARRVATLRRGTEVQVLDVSGNWAHVMAGSSEGYVMKNFLRM